MPCSSTAPRLLATEAAPASLATARGEGRELAEPEACLEAGRGGRGALSIGVDMALDTGSVNATGVATCAAVGMGSEPMRTCVGATAAAAALEHSARLLVQVSRCGIL